MSKRTLGLQRDCSTSLCDSFRLNQAYFLVLNMSNLLQFFNLAFSCFTCFFVCFLACCELSSWEPQKRGLGKRRSPFLSASCLCPSPHLSSSDRCLVLIHSLCKLIIQILHSFNVYSGIKCWLQNSPNKIKRQLYWTCHGYPCGTTPTRPTLYYSLKQ